jgi:hypothetical protein
MSSQAFRLGGRPIPLLKGALGAAVALAAISLSPGSAQAACAPGTAATLCRVTVGGLQYDVTTFTGSYNGNPSNFETPANNGVMPWWTGGSNATATAFVTEVGGYFGTGLNGGMSFYGPIFAYSVDVNNSNFLNSAWRYDDGTFVDDYSPNSLPLVYAQATLYTASAAAAPGPLPLFGAGAAFGFSRQLRKRIQGARLPIGSSQPLA